MGRFWSLLFLSVPILGVAAFVFAVIPGGIFANHWLPEDISQHGAVIDKLFMFIMYLTGVVFIATSFLLFWFMWKYDADKNTEPVKYLHGSHTLEIIWSIIPAATLLFIAIFQMDAWADARMKYPTDKATGLKKPPLLLVTGRQFEWRLQYAGEDEIIGTQDDIHLVNDLRIPVNEEIVIQIQTQDVLHSFFLPNMRIKQDVVPGMKQHLWFEAKKTGTYDIVCAELCGWGHYKMRGRLIVQSEDDFREWMASAIVEQNKTSLNANE
ncbi:MAG: cytochrome c oxidase subunit II [Planctomycetaceae bacterium]|nr:cytochrome c oxidase subunit II [Planctomycetaceae bacterium]